MAPKAGNEWKDHGWWIKVDDSQKALLWITSHLVLDGRHWSVVGKAFGQITAISPLGSDDVLVTASTEGSSSSKIQLQRRLLFASIPRVCLEVEPVLRGMRGLNDLWLSLPSEF
jgi:hypothetical protein